MASLTEDWRGEVIASSIVPLATTCYINRPLCLTEALHLHLNIITMTEQSAVPIIKHLNGVRESQGTVLDLTDFSASSPPGHLLAYFFPGLLRRPRGRIVQRMNPF